MRDERAPGRGGPRVVLRAAWRTAVVVVAFLPLLIALARDRRRFLLFGGRRRVTTADRRRRAAWLTDRLVSLGPAFVKLGQVLSTRPDALPREYVEALSTLQDEVPPAEWPAVRDVIEAELGPVAETFDEFDPEAISGASLGQVHTGVVDGERVAVKVLRPGIRQVVEADLRVVGTLLPPLARLAPPGQAYTLANLADEFAATIRREMDYGQEAAMLEAIGDNLASDPKIRVPVHDPSRSTDRVLTMEYVEGVKITDVDALDDMGVDRTALVRRLEQAYMEMIIEDGLFHADPHPGNLAVQPDGTLVFYDFGMTGVLDRETREHLREFYVAVARDDVDAVLDAFAAMGALDPAANRALVREMFQLTLDRLRGEDVETGQFRDVIESFQTELYEFPLRLPANLALVVRVSTVLEGVARTLDPDFDFVAVVTEYVTREGLGEEASAREAVESRVVADASETLRAFARSSVRVPPALDRVLTRAERDDLAASVRLDERRGRGPVGGLARRVALGVLTAGTTLVVVLLFAVEGPSAAAPAALALLPLAGLLWRALRRSRSVDAPAAAEAGFTRQRLRRDRSR